MQSASIGAAAARLARDPRWHLPASFGWGFAEATLFFVVPDVVVGWVALHDWRKGVLAALAATAGALLGGLLVLLQPDLFLDLLPRVPTVSDAMLADAGAQVEERGLMALLLGPLGGIPYKAYAAHLGAQGADPLLFLALSVPARLERLLPAALLCGLVGWLARRRVRERPGLALAAYAAVWLLQYALYLALLVSRYGGL